MTRKIIEIETERLKLRQWQKGDWQPFAELNADPVVMEYFPETLGEEQSKEMALKLQALISERGWGLWATEEKASARFIGFVGLHEPSPELFFSPCVEIGWRLAKDFWGKGYATEAAKAVLRLTFEQLRMKEIYSFTSIHNLKSIAVMERLHMTNTGQNFQHPKIEEGHWLREHVLYKLTREEWKRIALLR